MELENYVNLLPDIYDKTAGANPSNITKIFSVIADQLGDIVATHEANRLIKNLAYAEGTVLDLIGDDYGLQRYGKTDEQYRAFILAKIFGRIGGNNVNKILTYFSFFISSGNVRLLPLTDAEILNPILKGFEVHRAFSIEIDNISAEQEDILTQALQFLKAAGIYATINFTKKFDPETDLPGSAWDESVSYPDRYWQQVTRQIDAGRLLLVENKASTGSDANFARPSPTSQTEWSEITSIAFAPTNAPLKTQLRDGDIVYWLGSNNNTSLAREQYTFRLSSNGTVIALESSHPSKYSNLIYVSGTRRIAHLFNDNQMSVSNDSGGAWSDTALPHASTVIDSDITGDRIEPLLLNLGGVLMVPARVGAASTSNRIYIARSTDNGSTYSGITLTASALGVIFNLSGNASSGAVLAAHRDGLYRSTDSGASFSYSTWASLSVTWVSTNNLIVTKQITGSTFLMYRNAGKILYRSTNDGAAWSEVSLPDIEASAEIERMRYADGKVFIVSFIPSGVRSLYISEDDGATFTLVLRSIGLRIPSEVSKYGSEFIFTEQQSFNAFVRYMPSGTRFLNAEAWQISNSYGTTALTGTSSAFSERLIYGVLSGGNLRVYAATNNLEAETTESILQIESKRTDYRTLPLPVNAWANVVREGSNIIAASSEYHGCIAFSSNGGTSWSAARFPEAIRPKRFLHITKFKGLWVAFWYDDLLSRLYAAQSADGLTFTTSTSVHVTPSGLQPNFAQSDDYIFSVMGFRYDGSTFSAISSVATNPVGASYIDDVLYIGGQVGSNAGYKSSSDNGASATTVDTGIAFTPIAYAVNDAGFMVWINAGGDVVWSVDGSTFELRENVLSVKNWHRVIKDQNSFVTIATDGPPSVAISKLILP